MNTQREQGDRSTCATCESSCRSAHEKKKGEVRVYCKVLTLRPAAQNESNARKGKLTRKCLFFMLISVVRMRKIFTSRMEGHETRRDEKRSENRMSTSLKFVLFFFTSGSRAGFATRRGVKRVLVIQ